MFPIESGGGCTLSICDFSRVRGLPRALHSKSCVQSIRLVIGTFRIPLLISLEIVLSNMNNAVF